MQMARSQYSQLAAIFVLTTDAHGDGLQTREIRLETASRLKQGGSEPFRVGMGDPNNQNIPTCSDSWLGNRIVIGLLLAFL